jgi:peptidoglycan/xylan/chitin deacetylase (PgdA/CDA1 family)
MRYRPTLSALILALFLISCTPAAIGVTGAGHLAKLNDLAPGAASARVPPAVSLPLPSAVPTRPQPTPLPSAAAAYCLWPGDTFTAIAHSARIDLSALEEFNPDATHYAGSTIHLPPGSLPPDQWTDPKPVATGVGDLPNDGNGIYLGANNRQKRVALTFDVGYVPENRERMIWLHDQGIHATFFVLGISVSRHPDIVTDVLSNGHALGNHSWDHLNFQNLTADEIRSELDKTENAVHTADLLATSLPYFRAPFGAVDPQVNWETARLGYRTVAWTVDSHDWEDGITGDQVYDQVTRNVCPGAIVAMHDANPANTAALPKIIGFLRANGYEIVSLRELLGF